MKEFLPTGKSCHSSLVTASISNKNYKIRYTRISIRANVISMVNITNDSIEIDKNISCFWNFSFDKGRLKSFVSWFLKNYGEKKTIELLEQLKDLGFGYATKAGISLGIDDLKIPPQKLELIRQAEAKIAHGLLQYKKGEITGVERFQQLIDTWHQTSESLKQEVIRHFEATDVLNPVYMMAFSGARGNISQVRQLVGMRGLMADPQGKIIDFPIRSNFREGLTLTEYIISTYGARKGIVDTALRTATAGYLTRRLVDVAQHVIVSQFDCGTNRGIFLFDMKEGNKIIYSFKNRLIGRVLAKDIMIKSSIPNNEEITHTNEYDSKKSHSNRLDVKISVVKNREIADSKKQKIMSQKANGLIATRNQEISSDLAGAITKMTKKAFVRSPLTCETRKLVCQLCYGWSLANNSLVSIGEAVGVIAAQSIGEPGTQLTMRTFHTGGVFSGGLTDQIRAPYDGKVKYTIPIAGTCVRTPQGQIAFLTKTEGFLTIQKSISNTQEDRKSKMSLNAEQNANSKSAEQSSNPKIFLDSMSIIKEMHRVPAYTLLFARNGQNVFKKQIIAQFSTISQQQTQRGDAEQTIYADLEGELYYSHIDLLELRNKKYGDITWKTEDWAKLWILAGKIYKDPIYSYFFPNSGDLINQNTVMNQICWVSPYSCFLETNWNSAGQINSNLMNPPTFLSSWNNKYFMSPAIRQNLDNQMPRNFGNVWNHKKIFKNTFTNIKSLSKLLDAPSIQIYDSKNIQQNFKRLKRKRLTGNIQTSLINPLPSKIVETPSKFHSKTKNNLYKTKATKCLKSYLQLYSELNSTRVTRKDLALPTHQPFSRKVFKFKTLFYYPFQKFTRKRLIHLLYQKPVVLPISNNNQARDNNRNSKKLPTTINFVLDPKKKNDLNRLTILKNLKVKKNKLAENFRKNFNTWVILRLIPPVINQKTIQAKIHRIMIYNKNYHLISTNHSNIRTSLPFFHQNLILNKNLNANVNAENLKNIENQTNQFTHDLNFRQFLAKSKIKQMDQPINIQQHNFKNLLNCKTYKLNKTAHLKNNSDNSQFDVWTKSFILKSSDFSLFFKTQTFQKKRQIDRSSDPNKFKNNQLILTNPVLFLNLSDIRYQKLSYVFDFNNSIQSSFAWWKPKRFLNGLCAKHAQKNVNLSTFQSTNGFNTKFFENPKKNCKDPEHWLSFFSEKKQAKNKLINVQYQWNFSENSYLAKKSIHPNVSPKDFDVNKKDLIFSFIPLKNFLTSNIIKEKKIDFVTNKKSQNGLKPVLGNTYQWSPNPNLFFQWFPHLYQTYNNGIFIFSGPLIFEKFVNEQKSTGKTKEIKQMKNKRLLNISHYAVRKSSSFSNFSKLSYRQFPKIENEKIDFLTRANADNITFPVEKFQFFNQNKKQNYSINQYQKSAKLIRVVFISKDIFGNKTNSKNDLSSFFQHQKIANKVKNQIDSDPNKSSTTNKKLIKITSKNLLNFQQNWKAKIHLIDEKWKFKITNKNKVKSIPFVNEKKTKFYFVKKNILNNLTNHCSVFEKKVLLKNRTNLMALKTSQQNIRWCNVKLTSKSKILNNNYSVGTAKNFNKSNSSNRYSFQTKKSNKNVFKYSVNGHELFWLPQENYQIPLTIKPNQQMFVKNPIFINKKNDHSFIYLTNRQGLKKPLKTQSEGFLTLKKSKFKELFCSPKKQTHSFAQHLINSPKQNFSEFNGVVKKNRINKQRQIKRLKSLKLTCLVLQSKILLVLKKKWILKHETSFHFNEMSLKTSQKMKPSSFSSVLNVQSTLGPKKPEFFRQSTPAIQKGFWIQSFNFKTKLTSNIKTKVLNKPETFLSFLSTLTKKNPKFDEKFRVISFQKEIPENMSLFGTPLTYPGIYNPLSFSHFQKNKNEKKAISETIPMKNSPIQANHGLNRNEKSDYDLILKQGWMYIPLWSDFSKLETLHQSVVDLGKNILDDLSFSTHKVYLECLPLNLTKSSFSRFNWENLLNLASISNLQTNLVHNDKPDFSDLNPLKNTFPWDLPSQSGTNMLNSIQKNHVDTNLMNNNLKHSVTNLSYETTSDANTFNLLPTVNQLGCKAIKNLLKNGYRFLETHQNSNQNFNPNNFTKHFSFKEKDSNIKPFKINKIISSVQSTPTIQKGFWIQTEKTLLKKNKRNDIEVQDFDQKKNIPTNNILAMKNGCHKKILNSNCRFFSNFGLIHSKPRKIGLLIRPMHFKILMNPEQYKTQIYKFHKKIHQPPFSLLLYKNFYSSFLNQQKSSRKFISTFPGPDFKMVWKLPLPSKSFKKSHVQTSTNTNFWNLSRNRQKIIKSKKKDLVSDSIKPNLSHSLQYIHQSKKTHSIFRDQDVGFWNIRNYEQIYFSAYPINFLPLQMKSWVPTNVQYPFKTTFIRFQSSTNLYQNSFKTSAKFNNQIIHSLIFKNKQRIEYLLSSCSTSKKQTKETCFINKTKSHIPNVPPTVEAVQLFNPNTFLDFTNHSLIRTKTKDYLTMFLHLFGLSCPLPSLNFSISQKMAYFANQRLFASYFLNQKLKHNSNVPEKFYNCFHSTPISKNQWILYPQKLILSEQNFATTSFFSPIHGEILPNNITVNNLLLENSSNQTSLQNFNNSHLILTKSDLFSVCLPNVISNSSPDFLLKPFKNEILFNDLGKNLNFEKFSKTHVFKNNISTFLKEVYISNQNFKLLEQKFYEKLNLQKIYVPNLVVKYKNKIYKIKGLTIGPTDANQKLRLGKFLVYGNSLYSEFGLDRAGQIIHINSQKITLRHAQSISVSPKGILHTYNNDYITKDSPVMTLPFQTLKTGDIVQGIPKVEQYFEARTTQRGRLFVHSLPVLLQGIFERYRSQLTLEKAVQQSFLKIQQIIVDGVQRVYRSQGVSIADKHLEVIVRQMTSKVQIVYGGQTGFFPGEFVDLEFVERVNRFLMVKIRYEPVVLGITRASLEVDSFLSAASFQQTTKILAKASVYRKKDFLKGLKENILVGNLIPAGTGYLLTT
uniref:DNA-directed RNA polymerase subunit beta'' n=1 Tax=Chromochloris zofingiensis TaxID=31302 RepID=A0A140HA28_9CHLO|nr:RNA polymerase beta subunit [Chromochloris zofingiensis]AMO01027.1 RNA polymerase beta subunit [Chromochloris zofingiensis]